MKITAFRSLNTSGITEYLDFNRIPYDLNDLWQKDLDFSGRHIIGSALTEDTNRLLIIDYSVFHAMCQWPTSMEQIIKFCNNNNKIWIWSDIDALMMTVTSVSNYLLDLNYKIPNGSIRLFLDGKWSDRHPLTKLSNIDYRVFPYSFFLRSQRIENSICDKVDCSRDFMLTMGVKKLHRDLLFKQINSIDGLVNRGHVNYNALTNKIIGLRPHQNSGGAWYPSMDLYRDSWMEIVPETLFKDGFFITEKTAKPIMTKTPFLIVSTCGYLEYLHQHGFKTFGNIINEKYNQQYLVEDRVRLMLEQLCDIIQNGSESFYKACKSVLDHNQNRLLEISGSRVYDTDIFILNNLKEIGIC